MEQRKKNLVAKYQYRLSWIVSFVDTDTGNLSLAQREEEALG